MGLLPADPSTIVLPVVLLSALAGCIGCAIRHHEARGAIGQFALRVGIRAAVVATLVSGALIVSIATLQAFRSDTRSVAEMQSGITSYILPASRPAQVLIVALLGIPPAIFFGVAASLTVAATRRSPSLRDGRPTVVDNLERPVGRRSLVFAAVLALSTIGYASPLVLLFRSKPFVQSQETHNAVTPPSFIPKWRYEKSANFDSTDAARLIVVRQAELGHIDPSLPVAISPDGKHFAACFLSGGIAIQTWNLEDVDVTTKLHVQGLDTLTWSPDSRRLLYTAANPQKGLSVIDVEHSLILPLPQPKNGRIPNGLPNWWQDIEVLFVTGGDAVQILSLDTLRVRPAEESAEWRKLNAAEQRRMRQPPDWMAHTARWEMAYSQTVLSYDVPMNDEAWSTHESVCLGVIGSDGAYRATLRMIPLEKGDGVVAARDGTKAVRIHDGIATAFYFGTRPAPPLGWRVPMPDPREGSFKDVLAKETVCAFICAPLINPLNGKTVGPDRERVKAIARVANWEGTEAEIRVDREFLPIERNDVVADLHIWKDGRARRAGSPTEAEWFAVLPSALEGNAPPKTDAKPLERDDSYVVSTRSGASRIEQIIPYKSARLQHFRQKADDASDSGTASKAGGIVAAGSDVERTLIAFLQAHHAKSSRGDIEGLVADYAELVEHFQNGLVDRAFIRKDEATYHSPGTTVNETMTGRPALTSIGTNLYRAVYTISYYRVRPDGRWAKGESDIELQIELSPQGPHIVFQQAQNRNQQKGP